MRCAGDARRGGEATGPSAHAAAVLLDVLGQVFRVPALHIDRDDDLEPAAAARDLDGRAALVHTHSKRRHEVGVAVAQTGRAAQANVEGGSEEERQCKQTSAKQGV